MAWSDSASNKEVIDQMILIDGSSGETRFDLGLPLCLCVSLPLSLSHPISLYPSLSVSPNLSLSLSLCLSLSLSPYLSLPPYLPLSPYLSLVLALDSERDVCWSMAVHLPTSLVVCVSVCACAHVFLCDVCVWQGGGGVGDAKRVRDKERTRKSLSKCYRTTYGRVPRPQGRL